MSITGVAAYLAEKEASKKRCMKKYKKAKAFSPETAMTPQEAGIAWHEKKAIKPLVREGKLKQTEDGRFYLECKDGKHC